LKYLDILSQFPYSYPFLFVDELFHVDDSSAKGVYTFPENSFYYKGHFKDFPVTPGVILTECMAQIGVVSLGIFLSETNGVREKMQSKIALSSTDIDFFLPVFPGEKVRVVSEKLYFRFNKLKCSVKMFNVKEKLICKGTIAGMIKTEK